jgi:hypothetical protein
MSYAAALAALQTALNSIDPSPQPGPEGVYLWPDDQASIDYEALPFIIVAYCNRPILVGSPFFRPAAQGAGYHSWPAEINLCLANGPITGRIDQQATVEALQEPWILAMARVLFANQGLGGKAIFLGENERLFAYRIGNIGWGPTQVFWGIHFEVTVTQYEALPSI